MSTPSIAERVAAGVAWQDINDVPGWWKPSLFDLERLDMQSCSTCVLGQRYGDYYNAPLTLFEARDLGFEVSGESARTLGGTRDEYAALQAEWRRVIEERRQAAGEAS